jgi:class 3 adenylate cyclase
MEPQIQYCSTSDGVNIAYAAAGTGPPLVFLRASASHLALDWRMSSSHRNYEWLARRHTLVRFDPRGTGLSQREGFQPDPNGLLDMEAVAQRLGLAQFVIFALGVSVSRAIAYAGTHPEQVSRMVLWNGFASFSVLAAAPWVQAVLALLDNDWITYTETYAAVITGWEEAAEARSLAALMRESVTQDEQRRRVAEMVTADVSAMLPRITAPTLVVHMRESVIPDAAARAIVSGIPNARLQVVDGKSVFVPLDEPRIAPWLEAFLSGEPGERTDDDAESRPTRDTPFRTVLFTDIVGHTPMMQRLGDAAGRTVLREHERITREVLRQHGGTEIKTIGDSFMASFSSASSGVECAVALQRAFAQHNASTTEQISVRIGLNAGEPIEEEDDLFGAAVTLASRIMAQAQGGEILVSDVVRQLVAGKGFLFDDRGETALRGFEDPVRLYDVRWREE